MVEPLTALSNKMKVACVVYAKTFSPAEAEREAHLTAGVFREHLSDPLIQREISKNVERLNNMTLVDAAVLLEILSEMVHADIGDIYEDDGVTFKMLKDWPKVWRQMVAGYEAYPSGRPMKVKFVDRLKLIELTGKHIKVGAFQENHKITHDLTERLADKLRLARERHAGLTIDHATQSAVNE